MPLNVFRAFSGSSRGDGEGFFRRHARSREDSSHRYPSIRRQVLTKGFRNDEAEEVILPVPPPNFSRQASVQDYEDTNSLDSEMSYTEVPRDFREPSVHRTPNMHGIVPAVRREEYPNHTYEPSIHHFDIPPPAEDEYSDIGESPIPDGSHYPMGGYSGRDMVQDPVHYNPSPIATIESVDSPIDDHYVGDGRRHPAFGRNSSQPAHSLSSSRAPSILSSRPRGLSHPEFFSPPVQQRDVMVDPYDHGDRQYEEPLRHVESRASDTYYIVPAGTNVIFQDEDGNEITRVGDFSGKRSRRPRRESPLIVQDEYGREIYRTPGYGTPSYGTGSDRVSYMDHYGSSQGSEMSSSAPGSPNVILLDRYGRQIPLTNTSGSMSSGGSSGSYSTGYGSGR